MAASPSSIHSLIKETDAAVRKLYLTCCVRDTPAFVAVVRSVDKMMLWGKGDFESLWIMEREDKARMEAQLETMTNAIISSASAPCLNFDMGFDEESPIEHGDDTGSLAIPIGFPIGTGARTPLSDLIDIASTPVPRLPVVGHSTPQVATLLPSPIGRPPFLEEFF